MREITTNQRYLLLATVCITAMIDPMINSMVNVGVVAIGADLACSAHDLGKLTTVFYGSCLASAITMARLADIYGKRRVFFAGILITFMAMSLCSASQNLVMLYVSRAMSGVGASALMAVGLSMLVDSFPKEQKGMAVSAYISAVYISIAIGPYIGGHVITLFGWRAMFLINIPLAVIGALMILKYPHNVINTEGEPFDIVGGLLFALSIVSLMIGLTSIPSLFGFACFLGGLLVLFAFVGIERRTEYPVLHMGVFRNIDFDKAIVARLFAYISTYSIPFTVSMYLQSIGQMTATEVGTFMMFSPMVQTVSSLVAGRLYNRAGPKMLTSSGMVLTFFGLLVTMLSVDVSHDLPSLYVGMFLIGVGMGLFISPNTTNSLTMVESRDYNKASAMVSGIRMMGMTFSLGLATCLLAIFLGTGATITPENHHAYVNAIDILLVICMVFALLSFLMCRLVDRSSTSRSDRDEGR